MRKKSTLSLVGAAVALVCASAAVAQTPVERHGQLSVSGNRIVGKHGNPVQLRGMSLYWSMGPGGRDFYNASAVQYLAANWKVSVIRAAMGVETNFWNEANQQGYISNPTANLARVKAVVDGAIAAGIYVIIDWHSHEAESYTAQAKSFFEEMARTYGGKANVIYEIYNEPIGTASTTAATWSTIKTYANAIVPAIRAIDGENLIIIGTPLSCQYPNLAAADPVAGKNLAYTVHFYAAEPGHQADLRNRTRDALKKGAPIFASEMGTCAASGKGTINSAQTDTWFRLLDEYGVSWANWSIGTADETASALKSGASASGNWNDGNLTESGKLIRGKLIDYANGKELTTLAVGAGSIGRGTYAPYASGASVTLTATPDAGWVFKEWSGDASGTANPVTVTMNADKIVKAIFTEGGTSVLTQKKATDLRASWSIVKTGTELLITGPAESGATASIYDTRGKIVKNITAKDGQTLSASGIPTGSYLVVIKNRVGADVYRSRVSFVR